jgi:predicted hydrocarbon binding protein
MRNVFSLTKMFDDLYKKILMRTLKIEHGQPILLNKIPFVMFPARSMAKFVQKIGEDFGEDYVYDLGFKAGKMVAEEFVKKLGWIEQAFSKRMSNLLQMFEVMGFGKMTILAWNTKDKKVLIRLTNHPVISHSVRIFGKNEKICTFYRGIFSAHVDYELGVEGCHFIETQCISKNAKFCEWSHNYFKKVDEPPKEQKLEEPTKSEAEQKEEKKEEIKLAKPKAKKKK